MCVFFLSRKHEKISQSVRSLRHTQVVKFGYLYLKALPIALLSPPTLFTLQSKLEGDLTEFAGDYHQRVLKGLAPAAEVYLDEEGEGEEEESPATILPDGTIDVTPVFKKVRGRTKDMVWPSLAWRAFCFHFSIWITRCFCATAVYRQESVLHMFSLRNYCWSRTC